MKFLKIKYNNYRCFKDLEVNFDVNSDRNISLILGDNGAGKTEMLFSFWWVLYGFDFSSLKAKLATPYSLNSSLYLDLESGDEAYNSCSVCLDFESEGIKYQIKKTEYFVNNKNKIVSNQELEFTSFKENGEREVPERDPKIIDKKLTYILPKKILHGLVFDGERMEALSDVDEKSIQAVEGVIKHITNEQLFEMCRNEFKEIKKQNDKDLRKIANAKKDFNLEKIVKYIEEQENRLDLSTTSLQAKKDNLDSKEKKINEIRELLKYSSETKALEVEREGLRNQLNRLNKSLNSAIDEFYKSLRDGYLLISNKLLTDVEESLCTTDIPAGLTVEAVKNILSRNKCICGRDFDVEAREILNDLISTLPPDNINSTISEMVRGIRKKELKNVKNNINNDYKKIIDIEKDILETKETLVNISSKISSDSSDKIKQLEEDHKKFTSECGVLNKEILELEKDISSIKQNILTSNSNKSKATNLSDDYDFVKEKENYISKCLQTLNMIDEYNKVVSLDIINDKLGNAYSKLSEDYARGRRLYIVQYDKEFKFRLVPYYDSKYNDLYNEYLSLGRIDALKGEGYSDKQIREEIILKIAESNSTGQSKINSLAFAKAILDYSSEVRDQDTTLVTKDYPFIIDSPFTELSGGNLMLSSQDIPTFAKQIILFASEESIKPIYKNIESKICSITKLKKIENDSYSVKDGE